MFDVIIVKSCKMKHFANFRDCRIKHNEINGGQPLGNTFGFPLRLHLLHFRHQIVAPGEHGTPRSDCLSVGILFEKVAIRIGRVHKFGIDDNIRIPDAFFPGNLVGSILIFSMTMRRSKSSSRSIPLPIIASDSMLESLNRGIFFFLDV